MDKQLELFPNQPLSFSDNWINACIRYRGRVLYGEKGHYCLDWDFLPMDETCIEYIEGHCHCEVDNDEKRS